MYYLKLFLFVIKDPQHCLLVPKAVPGQSVLRVRIWIRTKWAGSDTAWACCTLRIKQFSHNKCQMGTGTKTLHFKILILFETPCKKIMSYLYLIFFKVYKMKGSGVHCRVDYSVIKTFSCVELFPVILGTITSNNCEFCGLIISTFV